MLIKFLWFAMGGIFTSVFVPLTSYFIIRKCNRLGITVKMSCSNQTNESGQVLYRVIKLIVKNGAKVSLKNVVAHITINNKPEDILKEKKKIFCVNEQVEYGLVSWAKNIDNKNLPNIDINQGEYPDLNFIRYHLKDPTPYIEIASEQGFGVEYKEVKEYPKSRTVLEAKRDYNINVTITGDNFWPIKRKYIFDSSKGYLREQ